MTKFRFEVYEDNGGGLTMFIMDDAGAPVWAHSGYEYTPENLRYDMDQIGDLEDVGDLDAWDGCGMYDGCGFESWKDRGKTLEEVYEEISEDPYTTLVADSEGVYPEKACAASMGALGQ